MLASCLWSHGGRRVSGKASDRSNAGTWSDGRRPPTFDVSTDLPGGSAQATKLMGNRAECSATRSRLFLLSCLHRASPPQYTVRKHLFQFFFPFRRTYPIPRDCCAIGPWPMDNKRKAAASNGSDRDSKRRRAEPAVGCISLSALVFFFLLPPSGVSGAGACLLAS